MPRQTPCHRLPEADASPRGLDEFRQLANEAQSTTRFFEITLLDLMARFSKNGSVTVANSVMSANDATDHEGQQPLFLTELPAEKQFNNIPGTPIQYPSKAYESSCNSYTYRVSELIFGSLLASYILGFVSFAARNDLAPILQGLSISVTFCYLTAAYYVTYHNSILTMPHIPNRGLRFDFFIAIFQAVLFGMSMIWPNAFLIFLALSLASVFIRQTLVFTQLAKVFEDATGTAKGQSEWNMDFLVHQRFRTALKDVNPRFESCLNGWFPIEKSQWMGALLLLLIGCFLTFGANLETFLENVPWLAWCGFLKIPEGKQSWIQVALYGIIFLIVLNSVNRVFRDRATHIYVFKIPGHEKTSLLDMAATEVVNKLKTPN